MTLCFSVKGSEKDEKLILILQMPLKLLEEVPLILSLLLLEVNRVIRKFILHSAFFHICRIKDNKLLFSFCYHTSGQMPENFIQLIKINIRGFCNSFPLTITLCIKILNSC